MARDLWLTRREAIKIDKIKKSLTIPAATFECGPANGSINPFNTGSPLRADGTQPLTLSATTITLDFWAYVTPTIGAASWSIVELEEASSYGIKITTDSSTLTVTITTSSAAYTITYPTPWYQWARYTVAVDTANNLGKFYINGLLVGEVAVAAGSFATAAFDLWFGEAVFLAYFNGYLQEVAIYNVYKDSNAVAVLGTHKGTVGTYSGGLAHYWKLSEDVLASVGGVDLLNNASFNFVTDTYAPIKFGASFVPALYSVSLTHKTSFQFPMTRPTGCTGMLVVRWVDDDGETQRRKFWDLSGVDLAPIPADYAGEAVSEDFVLEWWNIDGADTLSVPEDITLRLSKTTAPTTSYDRTAVAAATLTVDTTLAQAFPLTPFPLTFNTQQTY